MEDSRQAAPSRRRNRRGEGARLSEEIVEGALALIDGNGTDEAVTLRAVARQVGIAAPSIYARFADRDEIIVAVVLRVFEELTAEIKSAMADGAEEPVEMLVRGCLAYVRYGLDHAARYGVLFSERRLSVLDRCSPIAVGKDGLPVLEFGAEAFALLVEGVETCVRSGASASEDVLADAISIWVAMHGTVQLRTSLPDFPWPDTERFVRTFVLSLAHIAGPAPPGPEG